MPEQFNFPTTFSNPFVDYWIDAAQRTVLFLDVLRQRGNQYREHTSRTAPHVLSFDFEVVMDGRTLDRPVNYGLVRIHQPEGAAVDPKKRPFVVVDPRAGHGPGIGGFKADSEIGVALAAGHPCYLIGFLPEPVSGQTIEDVTRAEAQFLKRVIELHPEADGKPCVIGNCQGGWAVMMLAALHPDLTGPVVIAGAPVSYWAGAHGKNPMRYSGGLFGGSWLTALTGDVGGGKFDGAWLVSNFESLDPANTIWKKPYNVYAKVDTEGPRFLEFEKYWGGYVVLNAEEMQFIVDKLFIGNKLSSSEILTSGGDRIDLRSIRSPIVVFCSYGDNITPPQQALGWITDLYENVDDIRAHGQTIIYCVHASIGHLGIFVSAKIAKKEHDEFAGNVDFIDVLPPGLYEAVLVPKKDVKQADLVAGDWMLRFEPRTFEDLRAAAPSDPEDDRRFAAVARLSEINLELYRMIWAPTVRAAFGPFASLARQLHPLRVKYELLSDANPVMRAIAPLAEQIRADRRSVASDNPFLQMQEQFSEQMVSALNAWRDARDQACERLFFTLYSSPALQAMLGISAEWTRPRAGHAPLLQSFVEARKADLRSRMSEGGLREALLRSLLHVVTALGGADERLFEAIRRIREEHEVSRALSLQAFKEALREQFFMLLTDRDQALRSIPDLVADENVAARRKAVELLHRVVRAVGEAEPVVRNRLEEIETLFGLREEAPGTLVAFAPEHRGKRSARKE
jgi:pimeloyl-ACP methyl ester carboxylesterase